MAHLYETSFFDTIRISDTQDEMQVGWQVLSSPPIVHSTRIPYEELLPDLLTVGGQSLEEVGGLRMAVAIVANPRNVLPSATVTDATDVVPPPLLTLTPLPLGYVDELLGDESVAAEMSPLAPRSLAELAALAGTSVVVSLGGLPAIFLIGEAIGLVVIRGLGAVSGALWDGARTEVADFGADVAATLLDKLRRRLGIRRRQRDSSEAALLKPAPLAAEPFADS